MGFSSQVLLHWGSSVPSSWMLSNKITRPPTSPAARYCPVALNDTAEMTSLSSLSASFALFDSPNVCEHCQTILGSNPGSRLLALAAVQGKRTRRAQQQVAHARARLALNTVSPFIPRHNASQL